MEFEIETGHTPHTTKPPKYPFDKVQAPTQDEDGNTIYASFQVPAELETKVRASMTNWNRKGEGQFSLRRQPDGSFRCFRVA